jgi:membrane protein
MNNSKQHIKSRFEPLINKGLDAWNYCASGVWSDTRKKWWVNIIKTLNLAGRSFLSHDLQSQACALTYRTILAFVPALALIFAIGRGFGFQNLLQDALFNYFPAQHEAIETALQFVDSYLAQASEGIFVGVGIIFLLWTLISLIGSVESSFNLVWGVKRSRSFWRKITDYTAMMLILPVLMICASGMRILVSSTLHSFFDFEFISPVIEIVLSLASIVFTWMFFTGVYILIPNTKVKFQNALIAGVLAGTGFLIIQWIFVSGQMYVAKYNAIYGGFAFLPLLLIWLQLVWVIVLAGALICYSSQNIFRFSFTDEINGISADYRTKVTIAVATIIVQRFLKRMSPITIEELSSTYSLPTRLAQDTIHDLIDIKLLSTVVLDGKDEAIGFQPAVDPNTLTVNTIRDLLHHKGYADFVPEFNQNFDGVNQIIQSLDEQAQNSINDVQLSTLDIKI